MREMLGAGKKERKQQDRGGNDTVRGPESSRDRSLRKGRPSRDLNETGKRSTRRGDGARGAATGAVPRQGTSRRVQGQQELKRGWTTGQRGHRRRGGGMQVLKALAYFSDRGFGILFQVWWEAQRVQGRVKTGFSLHCRSLHPNLCANPASDTSRTAHRQRCHQCPGEEQSLFWGHLEEMREEKRKQRKICSPTLMSTPRTDATHSSAVSSGTKTEL